MAGLETHIYGGASTNTVSEEDLPSNIWLPNLNPVTSEDAVRGWLIGESEAGLNGGNDTGNDTAHKNIVVAPSPCGIVTPQVKDMLIPQSTPWTAHMP